MSISSADEFPFSIYFSTLLRSKPLHLSSFVPAQVQMFSEGDIGVLPPLGVYDPLGLIETRDMRPN